MTIQARARLRRQSRQRRQQWRRPENQLERATMNLPQMRQTPQVPRVLAL